MTDKSSTSIEKIRARMVVTRQAAALFPGSDKAASLNQLADDVEALLGVAEAAQRVGQAHGTRCGCDRGVREALDRLANLNPQGEPE